MKLEDANVIDVMAQQVGEIKKTSLKSTDDCVKVGEFIYNGRIPHRIYEPLMVFHYVQRDLDNCLNKLSREEKINPGDWRVLLGEAGCLGDEMHQKSFESPPMWETGSFYAGSIIDTSVMDSYYGRYLKHLLKALRIIQGEYTVDSVGQLPITMIDFVTCRFESPPLVDTAHQEILN